MNNTKDSDYSASVHLALFRPTSSQSPAAATRPVDAGSANDSGLSLIGTSNFYSTSSILLVMHLLLPLMFQPLFAQ